MSPARARASWRRVSSPKRQVITLAAHVRVRYLYLELRAFVVVLCATSEQARANELSLAVAAKCRRQAQRQRVLLSCVVVVVVTNSAHANQSVARTCRTQQLLRRATTTTTSKTRYDNADRIQAAHNSQKCNSARARMTIACAREHAHH